MSFSSSTSSLEVDIQQGKPAMLHLDASGSPAGWVADHRDELRGIVAEFGSVHVRGLGIEDADEVGDVAERIMARLMTDTEAFASRDSHPRGIYSSSAWPPKQQMCMHHELSYRLEVPGLMMFACLVAPEEGGAIGLADSAAMRQNLPADLVERFEREGWILARNYTDEIGLSVAEAFGTDDRSSVERYCRENSIEIEWQPDGGLRTRQRRRAVVQHPVTGEECWFNQIAFLSEWTLNPEVRGFLIGMYGADALPFNTLYGNGDPLGEEVVQIVNDVYDANAVSEPLRAGDLILVDNIRTAHSRDPYKGPRDVLVAMGDGVRMSG